MLVLQYYVNIPIDETVRFVTQLSVDGTGEVPDDAQARRDDQRHQCLRTDFACLAVG